MAELRATLYFDGASKGNPGPSGAGAVLHVGGSQRRVSKPLPFRATNNVAEYVGLIEGLRLAQAAKVTHLQVIGDSELVVKQMTGKYRVNQPHLRHLHAEAKALVEGFARVTWRTVPRDDNRDADRQANLAADEAVRMGEKLVPYGDWVASVTGRGRRQSRL